MANANDVLRIAASQVGTTYGGKYWDLVFGGGYVNGSRTPYCACFVSWVFNQAGQSFPGLPGGYCPSIFNAGRSAGLQVNKYAARPGDVVLFDWGGDGVCDHIGIVEVNCGSYLQTLEGNTTFTNAGNQSTGGAVARRTRSFGVIKGVFRPHYGTVSGIYVPSASYTGDGMLTIDGWFGNLSTAKWQKAMGTPIDGVISGQDPGSRSHHERFASMSYERDGSMLIKAVQTKLGVDNDGYCGPITINAIQSFVGAGQDGYFGPESASKLQQSLNDDKWSGESVASSQNGSNLLDVDGWIGYNSVTRWQEIMGTTVDGVISGQVSEAKHMLPNFASITWDRGGSQLIAAVQRKLQVDDDGVMGYYTVGGLQAYLGVSVDHSFGPRSAKALQERLNIGSF